MSVWYDIKNFNERNEGYHPDHKFPLLRNSVAKHAKKLLYGKGIDITTENVEFKEEFMKWAEDRRFQSILEKAEELCSLYGVAYLVYDLNKDKKNVFVADPHMPIRPWYANGELIAVDLYIYKEISATSNRWIRERYSMNNGKVEVIRTGYKPKEDDGVTEISWDIVSSETRYNKEQKETLDIDFIPVFPIWNQNTYLRNPLLAYRLSDWYNAGYLESDYINALEHRTIERMINKSYIIGKSNSNVAFQNTCSHTGVIADGWINENIRGKEGETKVEIISVASKLADYREDLDHIKESFFDECGYSFQSTTDQAGSDTATGQMLMKGKDIETTVNKRKIRTLTINKMLQIIFERDDFQFIINENISIDENALMDIFQKAQTLMIMSPAEMRAKFMGITIEQAEEDIKGIQAEEQERMEAFGLGEEEEDNGDSAE